MLATSRVNRTRPAVGRDVDLLVDVGAIEQQRIGAGLALDDVAAVAGVPDEGVVAGAEERRVVATAAVDEIVALAADDDVIAVAAVERELDLAGDRRGVDGVVAGEAVDYDLVVGIAARDRHGRGKAHHRNSAVVAEDLDRVIAIGAVDDDGIRRTVVADPGRG